MHIFSFYRRIKLLSYLSSDLEPISSCHACMCILRLYMWTFHHTFSINKFYKHGHNIWIATFDFEGDWVAGICGKELSWKYLVKHIISYHLYHNYRERGKFEVKNKNFLTGGRTDVAEIYSAITTVRGSL